MLGPFFLAFYQLIAAVAALMPRAQGDALKARWALRFAAMTDGGLDDDFCEAAFQVLRKRPELIAALEAASEGAGMIALRRRMTLQSIRGALAAGSPSMFG